MWDNIIEETAILCTILTQTSAYNQMFRNLRIIPLCKGLLSKTRCSVNLGGGIFAQRQYRSL